jgi:hypothetical protein
VGGVKMVTEYKGNGVGGEKRDNDVDEDSYDPFPPIKN